ncbi:hypothetical protein [Cetobacterium sp.]|uniref:hypothetical protein n=1 Tax=Cetobacterium sp. TaxID=2071632 RepID=UPI0025C46D7D|nr:hypothetical protein [Cetobacterium sp.]
MPFQRTMNEISDNLIDNIEKKMIDLDYYKETKNLRKFRSVDGIIINSRKIIFAEFKKCDLFYKSYLEEREQERVEKITKEILEKVVDSFMVLLPKYLHEEMGGLSINHKIDIEIVLGSENGYDDNPAMRMRVREKIKMKTENLQNLENMLKKYRGTFYINEIYIRTAEEYKVKYKL